MRPGRKTSGLGLVLLVTALASPAQGRTQTSLGIDAGYFFPSGDWTSHRYAGVDQFQGGVAVGLDLEARVIKWFGLAVYGGYAGLSTGAWEDFAASRGEDVAGSARIFWGGLMAKPYVWFDANHELKLLLGMSYAVATGEESYGNLNYEYDFLGSGLAFTGGLEFNRYFNERIAIALKATGIYFANGVDYADGLTHAIAGFPLTVGLRFRF